MFDKLKRVFVRDKRTHDSINVESVKINTGKDILCFESDPLVLKAESHIECRLERFSTRFSKRLFLCVI